MNNRNYNYQHCQYPDQPEQQAFQPSVADCADELEKLLKRLRTGAVTALIVPLIGIGIGIVAAACWILIDSTCASGLDLLLLGIFVMYAIGIVFVGIFNAIKAFGAYTTVRKLAPGCLGKSERASFIIAVMSFIISCISILSYVLVVWL